jgi:hypothetical protein
MFVYTATDAASAVTSSIGDLSGQYVTVGAAAIAIGAVPFALRRVWGLAKSLAK